MDNLQLLVSKTNIQSIICKLLIRLAYEKKRENPDSYKIESLEFDVQAMRNLLTHIVNDNNELFKLRLAYQSLYADYISTKRELEALKPKPVDKLESNLRNLKIGNTLFTINS